MSLKEYIYTHTAGEQRESQRAGPGEEHRRHDAQKEMREGNEQRLLERRIASKKGLHLQSEESGFFSWSGYEYQDLEYIINS